MPGRKTTAFVMPESGRECVLYGVVGESETQKTHSFVAMVFPFGAEKAAERMCRARFASRLPLSSFFSMALSEKTNGARFDRYYHPSTILADYRHHLSAVQKSAFLTTTPRTALQA